jgi:hypothetical protein
MKPNAIVPRGPIKSSLIGHWEKLVFGCAVLASLCLLGNALSHSVYPETPARLMQKAEDVEARIERSTPPVTFSDLPPPRALRAMLQNTIAAIEPERFPMRELARPYADLKVRRKQPALLAAQDVKAFSGFGAIAISDRDLGRERFESSRGAVAAIPKFGPSSPGPMAPKWEGDNDPNEMMPSAAAGNPPMIPGAAAGVPNNVGNLQGARGQGRRYRGGGNRRPRSQQPTLVPGKKPKTAPEPETFALAVPAGAKLEGRYWVAVVGLIPVFDQEAEFSRVFRDATKTYSSDIPLYLYCDVQRAEVGANGGSSEFQLLDMDRAADDIAYWGAVYPELVDQRYLPGSVDVAGPLPPLVFANHDPDHIRHPETPLARAVSPKSVVTSQIATKPEAKPTSRRHRASAAARKGSTRAAPATAGRIAGDATPPKPPAQDRIRRQLLRFFDFSVTPGKTYRYRVRLALYNPNYAVPREYLADEKLAAAEEIFTGWSEPTADVRVSLGNELLAGAVDPAEPKAQVLVRQFDSTQAITVTRVFQMSRGSTANADGVEVPVQRLDPRIPGPPKAKVDFKTDATMVDLVGGAPLVGGPGGAKAPARMLFMNSDGELAILSETADAARYQIEVARLEAAISQPTMTMPRR